MKFILDPILANSKALFAKKAIVVLILLALVTTSCISELEPKAVMALGEHFDRKSFSKDGQSLVFGSGAAPYLIYVKDIDNPEDNEVFGLPVEDFMYASYFQLCLTDKIWVTYPPGGVASFDIKTNKWTLYPPISADNRLVSCHVLSESKIAFYDHNRIAVYENGWEISELPVDEVITGMGHNAQNQLVVITNHGSVYSQEESGWRQISKGFQADSLVRYDLVITNDGLIWLVDGRSVFAWDTTTHSSPIRFEFDRTIYFIFSDHLERVWVGNSYEVWLIQDKTIQEVKVKDKHGFLWFVEPAKRRIYYSDIKLLYYFNIDDLVDQMGK
jgi:WD40 repeat protein